MKRKLLFVILALVLIIPAAMVLADNRYLVPLGDSIHANEKLGFAIELGSLTEDNYGPFSIVITIDPDDPAVDMDLQDDVDMSVNKAKGTYVIKSSDLEGLEKLHFILRPDPALMAETEYTLTADVKGEVENDSESFTFTVTPAEEETEPAEPTEPTKPTKPAKETEETTEAEEVIDDGGHGGGGGGGGGDGEEPEYKGSSNNYLRSLTVTGHKMTQKFHKTRDTYFVDLKKPVHSLDVKAVPEDKTARVDIVGTHDVSVDMSKITILVTAKNGDERIYRIYVRYE